MRHIGIFTGVVTTLLLLLCTSCTTPTAGTETGNPDISACLSAALHTFDTVDAWMPSTYLTEGEVQLNPGRVTNSWQQFGIAKKMGDSTPATDTLSESSMKIIIRYDTVIIVDTQYIKDTLIVDTLINDQQYLISDDASTTTLLNAQYVRYDSIFILDTNVVFDTIIRTLLDTVLIAPSSPDSLLFDNMSQVIYRSVSLDMNVSYNIGRDSSTGDITLKQSSGVSSAEVGSLRLLSPEIHTNVLYNVVSRQTTSNGVVVTEAFSFLPDKSAANTMESISDAAITTVHGTVSLVSAFAETSLEVDFDAGRDVLFSTTADNRIHSLQRTTRHGDARVDRVVYGCSYFGIHADTAYLQREQDDLEGSISKQSINYRCVMENGDPLDHRKNRLIGCTRTVTFAGEKVKSMILYLDFATPVERGTDPSIAYVNGVIDFGKGLAGNLTGVVDYATKTIYGNYDHAGRAYRFRYALSDERAYLERTEIEE